MQVMIVTTDLTGDDDYNGEQLLSDIEELEHVKFCERYEDEEDAMRSLRNRL